MLIFSSHSASGYHSDSRRVTEHRKKSTTSELPSTPASRRNPYDFTGCLAHAELTERDSDGQVTQIFGIFDHNPECRASSMTRIPAVPLHPHVYEVALEQLQNGATSVFQIIYFLKAYQSLFALIVSH